MMTHFSHKLCVLSEFKKWATKRPEYFNKVSKVTFMYFTFYCVALQGCLFVVNTDIQSQVAVKHSCHNLSSCLSL